MVPRLSLRRWGLFGQVAGDRRGVSAVEFAMLAPVMIAFYFGLAEFCQGYMAQKRMGHSAAMVADLVAQSSAVTGRQIDDMFNIGGLIMKPFSDGPLKQRVSSVTRNNSDQIRVVWSRGDGWAARAVGSAMTIPTGLIERGETIIVTEATYDYDSPVDYLMPGITRFSHIYYLRPRIVESIPYTP